MGSLLCGARARSLLLVTVVALLVGGAGAAQAITYAPIDQPGPPLDVPTATLAAALACSPGVAGATRAPVLLVPGTGSTPPDNFGWNYEPALTALHIPWCAITLPDYANGDIQIAGEYVVYAIRTMYAMAGRRISIIGHSQGGMLPRWALRFWPDTRMMVDDDIGLAGTNHGTTVAELACQMGCSPADFQQQADSQFIAALNSYQETFPGISYTEVYTHTDEEVEPNQNSNGTSSLHGGGGLITNVATQDICPNDVYEHLAIGTIDPVAYALAIDALSHPGPATVSDIPLTVCAQQFMPGVNPATFPENAEKALVDDETSPSTTVTVEPPLMCYVTATCAGESASAAPSVAVTGCTASGRLTYKVHAPRGQRIVRVSVYVGSRLVRALRGRHLTSVTIARPATKGFIVTVVSTSDRGHRRTSIRSYSGCTRTAVHTRGSQVGTHPR